MINQNKLARRVSEKEGLKVQVNIAQIKEVQKWLLIGLAQFRNIEVTKLLDRIAKKYGLERSI